MGHIADHLNYQEESAKAYKTSLRLNPLDGTLKQALSDVLARQGKTDEAHLVLGADLVISPTSAETWLAMGRNELERKRFGDAEKAFRNVIRISPGILDAWAGLAAILFETNRFQEALQALDEALSLECRNPVVIAELLTGRGNAKSKLGDKQSALLDYRAALQAEPNFVHAWRCLGILKREANQHADVVSAFRNVVTSDITGISDWVILGEALGKIGEKQQALEALEKAEKIDPVNLHLLNVYAGFYGRNGNAQLALTYIERALNIDSSDAINWSAKGYTLMQLDRLPESINALETATNLDPNNANAWINLGEALMRSNHLGKAIQALEKAIILAPTALDARLYLAQTYLSTQQTEKARTHANAMLKISSDQLPALNLITLSYLMENNGEEALNSFGMIQTQNPQAAKEFRSQLIALGLQGVQALPE